MAGADWPEDIAFWRDTMTERGMGEQVIAQNDALGVLYLGAPDAVGVSIVCGTGRRPERAPPTDASGTAATGRTRAGSTHLGQKTLLAVYRAELGLEPPTSLTQRVLAHFGAASVEEVLHRFHNRLHETSDDIGSLAPILLDEAEAGDDVALRIVREHGAGLGEHRTCCHAQGWA